MAAFRIEPALLEKLSAESEEEKRILAGQALERDIYTGDGDFIVSSEKLSNGQTPISVRTHTRYVDFPPHRHNYVEMMILLAGRIVHRIGEEEVVLGEGDILLLNRHVTHAVMRAGAGDIGVNVILPDVFLSTLTPELSDTILSPLITENGKADGAGVYLHFTAGSDRRIGNLVENLLYELTEEREDVQILTRSLALLFRYLSLGSERLYAGGSTIPGRTETRRRLVLSYLHTHYRTATLTDLAARVYLTPPYLSKFIADTFGKGFKDLLLEERIRVAAGLIRGTDLPIGDIIRSVGYENGSYFHREFRRVTGSSPLAYRRAEKAAEKELS